MKEREQHNRFAVYFFIAIFFAIGLSLIGVAGHIFKGDDNPWRDIAMYIGKALLVGAVVEFVFAVHLVNDVVKHLAGSLEDANGKFLREIRDSISSIKQSCEVAIEKLDKRLTENEAIEKTILSSLESTIASHISVSKLLNDQGILSVFPNFDIDDFVESIRKCESTIDVDILQSHFFDVDHFAKSISGIS